MPGTIDARLADLGLTLPDAPTPRANYVPWVISQGMLYVSGQVPFQDGELSHVGKLGRDFAVEDGQACARVVVLNILAHAKVACAGDLDRIARVVKLGGFVNSAPDFTDQPKVINGASDLLVEIFGEIGRHARFAVGAPSLPFDVAVEIDALFELKG